MSARPGNNWPEYLIEACGLGAFMLSACVCAVVLEHPASPVRAAVGSALARRAVMGLAMGATAVAIVTSPWGRRSGAHINPAVTLAFLRLGRIHRADAIAYVVAQIGGGVAGVALARALLGGALAHPSVGFIVTEPGPTGPGAAFVAELVISAGMMAAVLATSSSRWADRTPLVAGALVALFIAFEAPLSGMSMNPARTLASSVFAGRWTAAWIYFAAPPLAMAAVAEVFARKHVAGCAKMDHRVGEACIHCGARGVEPSAHSQEELCAPHGGVERAP